MCFRVLRWNEYPGSVSGPNVIIRLLIRGGGKGPKLEILENAMLPALKVEEGATSQRMHVLLGADQSKKTDSPLEPPC